MTERVNGPELNAPDHGGRDFIAELARYVLEAEDDDMDIRGIPSWLTGDDDDPEDMREVFAFETYILCDHHLAHGWAEDERALVASNDGDMLTIRCGCIVFEVSPI